MKRCAIFILALSLSTLIAASSYKENLYVIYAETVEQSFNEKEEMIKSNESTEEVDVQLDEEMALQISNLKEIHNDFKDKEFEIILQEYFYEINSEETITEAGDIFVDNFNNIFVYIKDDIYINKENDLVSYTPEDSNKRYRYKKFIPEYEQPTELTAYVGSKLSSIDLPEGFYWEQDEILNEAGNFDYKVTYKPKNNIKFETVNGIEINITVEKAKAENVEVPVLDPVVYDPNLTLRDIKLPEGWEWKDESIVPTVIIKEYMAVYSPSNNDIFDYSDVELERNIPLTVNKASISYNETHEIFGVLNDTLENVELPKSSIGIFEWVEEKDTILNQLGLNTYHIILTPNDPNYEVLTDIPLKIMVTEAKVKIPEDLKGKYGQNLSDIILPERFFWENPEEKVGVPGEYSYPAKYVFNGEIKLNLNVEIGKSSAPVIIYPEELTCEWEENLTTERLSLPNNWSFISVVPLKIGPNNVSIIYSPQDTELYDYSNTELEKEIFISVTKAIPKYSIPEIIYLEPGQVLEDSMLPVHENGILKWNEKGATSGTYSCSFIPNDLIHYKTVTDISVEVVVKGSIPEGNETESIESETNVPESIAPETNIPESSIPESDAQENVIPDTEEREPETDKPSDDHLKDYTDKDITVEDNKKPDTIKPVVKEESNIVDLESANQQNSSSNTIGPSSSPNGINNNSIETEAETESELTEENNVATKRIITETEDESEEINYTKKKTINFTFVIIAFLILIITISAVAVFYIKKASAEDDGDI